MNAESGVNVLCYQALKKPLPSSLMAGAQSGIVKFAIHVRSDK